jgi:hypothetical protein
MIILVAIFLLDKDGDIAAAKNYIPSATSLRTLSLVIVMNDGAYRGVSLYRLHLSISHSQLLSQLLDHTSLALS